MDDFKKGNWKSGLFECNFVPCILQAWCNECALAQIHEKLGNPSFGKPVACILACCGGAGIQIVWYGQKQVEKGIVCGILKTWCCGACYLHQQYKECGATEDFGAMIKTCMSPSQEEMS